MTMLCITSTSDLDHLQTIRRGTRARLPCQDGHLRAARALPAIAVTAPATCAGTVPAPQPRRLSGMDQTISRTLLRRSELLAIERSRSA